MRDAGEIAVLVEKHVRLRAKTKGGGLKVEVALEPPFCHALNKLEGVGHAGGARHHDDAGGGGRREGRATLRMPVGLDRETGVIFRIPEELRSIMPKDTPTPEEARQAFRWLRDEWLCDVARTSRARRR